mmetsp:Transcript_11880/g.28833  ORF Transcript_11880/g.28833 Transcript_11880/m.28833 type:complete len:202 (-) Transcript_11880:278-883(-)
MPGRDGKLSQGARSWRSAMRGLLHYLPPGTTRPTPRATWRTGCARQAASETPSPSASSRADRTRRFSWGGFPWPWSTSAPSCQGTCWSSRGGRRRGWRTSPTRSCATSGAPPASSRRRSRSRTRTPLQASTSLSRTGTRRGSRSRTCTSTSSRALAVTSRAPTRCTTSSRNSSTRHSPLHHNLPWEQRTAPPRPRRAEARG